MAEKKERGTKPKTHRWMFRAKSFSDSAFTVAYAAVTFLGPKNRLWCEKPCRKAVSSAIIFAYLMQGGGNDIGSFLSQTVGSAYSIYSTFTGRDLGQPYLEMMGSYVGILSRNNQRVGNKAPVQMTFC